MDRQAALRMLPAVHRLLDHPMIERLKTKYPLPLITSCISEVSAKLRSTWDEGTVNTDTWQNLCEPSAIARQVEAILEREYQASLKPVLNLTGVVLHTNLGRAPLSDRAIEAVATVGKNYTNLEFELTSGERGSRHTHVERRICKLTGAEGALVVNNNAAAVLLVLSTLGCGGKALVSRGQLVEIGGSFRIPDIMKQSGVTLVEVGTTNKTKICDYAEAITDDTRLMMRVHTSNYRIVGFAEQPDLRDLVTLAHDHDVPLVEDLGSGSLFEYSGHGIGDDPVVRHSVDAGVDVMTFSGDKLLGGAQAGIVIGKRQYIERLKKHPLMRALRVDKLTLAALDATLIDHEDDQRARQSIPVIRMLMESKEAVRERANPIVERLQATETVCRVFEIQLVETQARVGGGALPLEALPSSAIQIFPRTVSTQTLFDDFRRVPTVPIVSRIVNDVVLLDVRTLLPDQENTLVEGIRQVANKYIREHVLR